MQVGLLGPLEVTDEDGGRIEVAGAKPRELLALLALHVGEVLAADVIADELWGEDQPADARNALQVLVSKLRKALPDDTLVTKAPGYVLALDPDAIDVGRFERMVAEERWDDALALWRGDALADFVYEPFAQQPRIRLQELRLTAIEQRIDADLATGSAEQLVSELESLVHEQPLRERFRGQLMLALYRSGRQADALRAYQEARTLLADELGLDPGVELQQLEAAILAQDPAISPPTDRSRHLPAPLSSFVGRTDELERVLDLVATNRVVTLVGPGGAGKTRLAIEAARAGAVDAWLVELAPVRDGASVVGAAATALGVDDAARIDDFFARREAVVVLDNCEHVVDAAAALAERLARSSDGVTVLATSRERLGVAGEAVWQVPPLSPEDAAALFSARAASDADVGDATAVQQVCERLDGLPLALELAAARTRTLSLDDIVTRLDDRFRLLTGGDRTAEPRQRTLRGVVDWSHDLLFAEEQALFRRLSVFVGGFGIEAVEAVCTDDEVPVDDVLDLLAHLVDKSLVTRIPRDRGTRYRMLETIAEYGRVQLDAAGETNAVRARHLAWVIDLTATAEVELRRESQAAWAARMSDEHHNVRAAIGWALASDRAADALAAAKSMAYAWYLAGQVGEGHGLLTSILAVADDAPPADHRCTAHAWVGWFGQHGASTLDEAATSIARAVEIGRDASVRPFVVATVFTAILRLDRGGPTQLELFDEAAARLAVEPDRWAAAMLGWARGTYAVHVGDVDGAAELLRQSVADYAAEGDRWGTVLGASRLGELAFGAGRYDEAAQMLLLAWEAISTTRTRAFQAAVLAATLGQLATVQDRLDEADEWHARALATASEAGFPRATAQTLASMGLAARRRGRVDEAERLLRDALAVLADIGTVTGEASVLSALGSLATVRGDLEEATRLQLDALGAARRSTNIREMALAVAMLGVNEAARGNPGEALLLLGAAEALRLRVANVMHGDERVDVEQAIERCRAALGDGRAGELHARGVDSSATIIDGLERGERPVA